MRAVELEFQRATADVVRLRLELEVAIRDESELRDALGDAAPTRERPTGGVEPLGASVVEPLEANEARRKRAIKHRERGEQRYAEAVTRRLRLNRAIREAMGRVDEWNNRRQLIRGVLDGARQAELRAAEEAALEEGLALHRRQAGQSGD